MILLLCILDIILFYIGSCLLYLLMLNIYYLNEGEKDISLCIGYDGGTTSKNSRMAISFSFNFLSQNKEVAGRLATSLSVHANVPPSPIPNIYRSWSTPVIETELVKDRPSQQFTTSER